MLRLLPILIVAAVAAAPARAADFTGARTCAYGAADCTPPVPDPVGQLRKLRDHGDLLGFHMNGAPDVTNEDHWQGVQRPSAGGGRYLIVTRKGGNASFVVVRMDSRPAGGERLRSNRIGARSRLVAPPAEDRIVYVQDESNDPGFHHSGGFQIAGNIMAVGLEEDGSSRVRFYDVSDPEHPRTTGMLRHRTQTKGAGTVSLAKLDDGRFLLIVGGADARRLDFYVSRPGTLDFGFRGTWRAPNLDGAYLTPRYQNLNLITARGGHLFLLGTYRNGRVFDGDDGAHLFRLSGTFARPRLERVAARHLWCGVDRVRQCDFKASGGAYVSPSGRLFLYSVEHDNDGPGGSVKAEEFRPVPHLDRCDTLEQAYVELYDDTGFDGDRSVMIDALDAGRRDYEDYDRVEGFEDKASAARWCLPPGTSYELYADKAPCGGRVVTLAGDGLPHEDRRFAGTGGAVERFDDAVSCSRWVLPALPTPTPTASPQPTPTPTPTPSGPPDLVVSADDGERFTITNQGTGFAGSFVVTVSGIGQYTFGGLPAGRSLTQAYPPKGCTFHRVTADAQSQVAESDEANNTRDYAPIC